MKKSSLSQFTQQHQQPQKTKKQIASNIAPLENYESQESNQFSQSKANSNQIGQQLQNSMGSITNSPHQQQQSNGQPNSKNNIFKKALQQQNLKVETTTISLNPNTMSSRQNKKQQVQQQAVNRSTLQPNKDLSNTEDQIVHAKLNKCLSDQDLDVSPSGDSDSVNNSCSQKLTNSTPSKLKGTTQPFVNSNTKVGKTSNAKQIINYSNQFGKKQTPIGQSMHGQTSRNEGVKLLVGGGGSTMKQEYTDIGTIYSEQHIPKKSKPLQFQSFDSQDQNADSNQIIELEQQKIVGSDYNVFSPSKLISTQQVEPRSGQLIYVEEDPFEIQNNIKVEKSKPKQLLNQKVSHKVAPKSKLKDSHKIKATGMVPIGNTSSISSSNSSLTASMLNRDSQMELQSTNSAPFNNNNNYQTIQKQLETRKFQLAGGLPHSPKKEYLVTGNHNSSTFPNNQSHSKIKSVKNQPHPQHHKRSQHSQSLLQKEDERKEQVLQIEMVEQNLTAKKQREKPAALRINANTQSINGNAAVNSLFKPFSITASAHKSNNYGSSNQSKNSSPLSSKKIQKGQNYNVSGGDVFEYGQGASIALPESLDSPERISINKQLINIGQETYLTKSAVNGKNIHAMAFDESFNSSIFSEEITKDANENNTNNKQFLNSLKASSEAPPNMFKILLNKGPVMQKELQSSLQSNQVETQQIIVSSQENWTVVTQEDPIIQQEKLIPLENKAHLLLELNLRMNRLEEISPMLFTSSKLLRCIDLRHNKLTSLPDEICDLPNLTRLYLDYNYLFELPESIGQLKALSQLTVQQNRLRQLPESLFKIENLEILQLNDNRLDYLANELGFLGKLKSLLLHNNFLVSIPTSLFMLSNITELSLDWFQYIDTKRCIPKVLKRDNDLSILLIKELQQICLMTHQINLDRSYLTLTKDATSVSKSNLLSVPSSVESISKPSQLHFLIYLMYKHEIKNLQDEVRQLIFMPKSRKIVHNFALNGHLYLFKQIMGPASLTDVNCEDEEGSTPLLLAMKNKRMEFIKFLLNLPQTNVNKGSSKYGCPIHLAIQSHEFKLAIKLVKNDKVDAYRYIDINAKNEEGNNALHFAFLNFNASHQLIRSLCKILIKRGININQKNKNGFTALYLAMMSNQIEALSFVYEFNSYNRQLQQKQQQVSEQAQSLQKQGTNANQPIFFQEISKKNRQVQFFDFNIQCGRQQWNALHLVVQTNNIKYITNILQSGEQLDFQALDVDGKAPKGLTPYNSPIYKLLTQYELRQTNTYQRENAMQRGGAQNNGNPQQDLPMVHYFVSKRNYQSPRQLRKKILEQAKQKEAIMQREQKHGSQIRGRDHSSNNQRHHQGNNHTAYSQSRGRIASLNTNFGQNEKNQKLHDRVLSLNNQRVSQHNQSGNKNDESPFVKRYKEHPNKGTSGRVSKSPLDNEVSYFDDYNISHLDFLPSYYGKEGQQNETDGNEENELGRRDRGCQPHGNHHHHYHTNNSELTYYNSGSKLDYNFNKHPHIYNNNIKKSFEHQPLVRSNVSSPNASQYSGGVNGNGNTNTNSIINVGGFNSSVVTVKKVISQQIQHQPSKSPPPPNLKEKNSPKQILCQEKAVEVHEGRQSIGKEILYEEEDEDANIPEDNLDHINKQLERPKSQYKTIIQSPSLVSFEITGTSSIADQKEKYDYIASLIDQLSQRQTRGASMYRQGGIDAVTDYQQKQRSMINQNDASAALNSQYVSLGAGSTALAAQNVASNQLNSTISTNHLLMTNSSSSLNNQINQNQLQQDQPIMADQSDTGCLEAADVSSLIIIQDDFGAGINQPKHDQFSPRFATSSTNKHQDLKTRLFEENTENNPSNLKMWQKYLYLFTKIVNNSLSNKNKSKESKASGNQVQPYEIKKQDDIGAKNKWDLLQFPIQTDLINIQFYVDQGYYLQYLCNDKQLALNMVSKLKQIEYDCPQNVSSLAIEFILYELMNVIAIQQSQIQHQKTQHKNKADHTKIAVSSNNSKHAKNFKAGKNLAQLAESSADPIQSFQAIQRSPTFRVQLKKTPSVAILYYESKLGSGTPKECSTNNVINPILVEPLSATIATTNSRKQHYNQQLKEKLKNTAATIKNENGTQDNLVSLKFKQDSNTLGSHQRSQQQQQHTHHHRESLDQEDPEMSLVDAYDTMNNQQMLYSAQSRTPNRSITNYGINKVSETHTSLVEDSSVKSSNQINTQRYNNSNNNFTKQNNHYSENIVSKNYHLKSQKLNQPVTVSQNPGAALNDSSNLRKPPKANQTTMRSLNTFNYGKYFSDNIRVGDLGDQEDNEEERDSQGEIKSIMVVPKHHHKTIDVVSPSRQEPVGGRLSAQYDYESEKMGVKPYYIKNKEKCENKDQILDALGNNLDDDNDDDDSWHNRPQSRNTITNLTKPVHHSYHQHSSSQDYDFKGCAQNSRPQISTPHQVPSQQISSPVKSPTLQQRINAKTGKEQLQMRTIPWSGQAKASLNTGTLNKDNQSPKVINSSHQKKMNQVGTSSIQRTKMFRGGTTGTKDSATTKKEGDKDIQRQPVNNSKVLTAEPTLRRPPVALGKIQTLQTSPSKKRLRGSESLGPNIQYDQTTPTLAARVVPSIQLFQRKSSQNPTKSDTNLVKQSSKVSSLQQKRPVIEQKQSFTSRVAKGVVRESPARRSVNI